MLGDLLLAAGPMEVLNMDYEVPFPEDEYGNTYVLTIIDTFSCAVGLYAVPNLEARHAARILVRHIGIFGCPSQIVSDWGSGCYSRVDGSCRHQSCIDFGGLQTRKYSCREC